MRAMVVPVSPGTRERGTLLLADISGYTGFLHGVADAHHALIIEAQEPPPAYALLSHLLDTMVAEITPPFRLVKFEGDAVFAVAGADENAIRGADVLDCLRSCHAAFEARLAEAGAQWTCTCDACARIGNLGLKFVLHHGSYVVQRIAGREELAGPDVIAAHRLLKNHARDLVGPRPYALLTDAVVDALEVPAGGMLPLSESYDDMPPIAAHVLALA
jgi:hypothetical protein